MLTIPSNFVRVADRPGWYKTFVGDWMETEQTVLRMHGDFPEPVQIVCGLLDGDEGHAIYLIENHSAIELARVFKTGSHNTWPSETYVVCAQLQSIMILAPFRPYFIDSAGYKARFRNRITREQADAIEGILTVGCEGYVSEWSGDGPFLLADTLVVENGLRLWWD